MHKPIYTRQFATRQSMRLKPSYFEEDFAEAVRIIEITLSIDDIVVPPEDDDDPDPTCPPIAFSGTARGVHMSRLSKVSGTVRKKRDYIRWTFVDVVCIVSLCPPLMLTENYCRSQRTRAIPRSGGENAVALLADNLGSDVTVCSAEGVQVGSVGCALGIAGIWTVAVHEDSKYRSCRSAII